MLHRASYRTPCFGTTLMRHFCYLSFTIAALPCSVIQPPLWTILVPLGRSSSSFPTRRQRTVVAIDVASITATANHSLSMASGAVVKSRSVLNPFWPSHGHDDESASLERFWRVPEPHSRHHLPVACGSVPLTWHGGVYRPLRLYQGQALRALRGLDRTSAPE